MTAIPAPGSTVPLIECAGAKPGQPVVPKDQPWDEAPTDPDSCESVLDVGCQARHAVTGWFQGLVKSAIGPTFTFLGATAFGTPEIGSPQMERTRTIWSTSAVIADTCFVLLITLAGVTLMAGTSLPRELGPRELLPRLVPAFVAANVSKELIGYGIELANGLAAAFLKAGREQIDPTQAADVMGRMVESTVNTGSGFFIFLALVAVVLAAWVALIYAARLALTMVLIAAAPLALMFHALPFTEGLARLWWRGISGLLAIQVCQSLVFVTALEILLSSDPKAQNNRYFYQYPTTKHDGLDLLLLICLLYVLVRIPSWVSRTIWQQTQPRMLGQIVKSLIVYRTIGAIFRRRGHAARRYPARARHPHTGPGGPTGGGPRRTGPNSGGPRPGPQPGSRPGGGGAGGGPRGSGPTAPAPVGGGRPGGTRQNGPARTARPRPARPSGRIQPTPAPAAPQTHRTAGPGRPLEVSATVRRPAPLPPFRLEPRRATRPRPRSAAVKETAR